MNASFDFERQRLRVANNRLFGHGGNLGPPMHQRETETGNVAGSWITAALEGATGVRIEVVGYLSSFGYRWAETG